MGQCIELLERLAFLFLAAFWKPTRDKIVTERGICSKIVAGGSSCSKTLLMVQIQQKYQMAKQVLGSSLAHFQSYLAQEL